MCAQEHSGGSSRRCADRDVLAVLPTCAKIAPVEHLHTAIEHLTQCMGSRPVSQKRIGRWTLLGWNSTDSTNSRALAALRRVSPALLDHVAITVKKQTAGRGQQRRPWEQAGHHNLACTLILGKGLPSKHPFSLNLAVSLAVLEAIESTFPHTRGKGLEIKWPNDIMWKGKKTGGILIENSWRGNGWSSAVIGIGVNLLGTPPFPNATCLFSGITQPEDADAIRNELFHHIPAHFDARLAELSTPEALLRQYHQRLHGWGQAQRWQLDGEPVHGILESIDLEGRLCVLENGVGRCFSPGEVGWLGMEPRM